MDLRVLSKQMELYPYQQLYFTTLAYGKLHPFRSLSGWKAFALKYLSLSLKSKEKVLSVLPRVFI